jgi:ribonuclease HI
MENQTVIVNTDGGARGNPGPAACSFIVSKNEKVLFKNAFYLGTATNNIAEYTAVLKALEWLRDNNYLDKNIIFKIDSELVVRQLNGLYKVKDTNLKKIYDKIKFLERNFFFKVSYNHVFREENFLADRLVNEELDRIKILSR